MKQSHSYQEERTKMSRHSGLRAIRSMKRIIQVEKEVPDSSSTDESLSPSFMIQTEGTPDGQPLSETRPEEEDDDSSTTTSDDDGGHKAFVPDRPNFFNLWTNIPTIEQFIKAHSRHVGDRDTDLLADGEEEDQYIASDLSSTGIEDIDLDEKKPSEMLMLEEEESEQMAEAEKAAEAEEEEVEEETSSESESSEFDDFQLPVYDDEGETTKVLQATVETPFQTLKDFESVEDESTILRQSVKVTQDDLIKREALQTTEIVHSIVENLIENSIESAERVNTEIMLRKKLDKPKLMHAIYTTYRKYQNEMLTNEALNRIVVDYYRRLKKTRYLISEDPKSLDSEKSKLASKMKHLDELIKMQVVVKETVSKEEALLERDYKLISEKVSKSVDKFESLIKNTCQLDSKSKHLQEVCISITNPIPISIRR